MLAGGCGAPQPPPAREAVTLVSVTDGDTIRAVVGGVEERVRYIGIDTPERGEPGFDEATDVNTELLDDGPLRLEFDAERRDRYGRLLAYVYAGDTFVNRELVRRCLAEARRYPPNVRFAREFEAVELRCK